MSRFRNLAYTSPPPDVASPGVQGMEAIPAFNPGLNQGPGLNNGVSPPSLVGRPQQAGFLLMAFVMLLTFSHIGRPFEQILVGLRIPAAICGLAILVSLAHALPVLKTSVGRALVMLAGWMLLVVPFSSWRGGSLSYVLMFAALWVTFFVLVATAPKTFQQMALLASMMAIAALFNILIAGKFDGDDRFKMSGTFGNSGDVAMLAGIVLPFWLFVASRLPMILRVPLSVGMTIFLLRVIILTATRSTLIALVCMFLIWLVRQKVATQMIATASIVVLFIGLIGTAPQAARARLSTIFEAFSSQGEERPTDEAAGSAAERRQLLKDGIWATLTHPIWGVGPGQFANYRWNSLGDGTVRKRAMVTHNSYVQVSSENGVPGGLLYIFFLGVTFSSIGRLRRATTLRSSPALIVGHQLASCLEMALVLFAVAAFFLSTEAHPCLFFIAGMAVAGERLARAELTRLQSLQPSTQPSTQPSIPGWRPWEDRLGNGPRDLRPAGGLY